MDRLLNVLTAASALLVLLVLVSLRRAHIRVEYSVSWLIAGVTLLVLSRARGVLEGLAANLGIAYPPLVLLLIIGCVFLVMFYRFSIILSRLRDDNIALAQKVAMLEYYVESLKDQNRDA
jgi:hypothetical protein